MAIEVKRHKGHSGKSVFEWRVYSVIKSGGRVSRTQLAKCRTEAAARKIAETTERRAAERRDAYLARHVPQREPTKVEYS